jgi:hypothetical protein
MIKIQPCGFVPDLARVSGLAGPGVVGEEDGRHDNLMTAELAGGDTRRSYTAGPRYLDVREGKKVCC